ncbi:hypothetical protein HGA91_04080 [candidate division WWE3 bacterium]|nr:hypothetical protein [candidate division WWE3 bacterium]
MDDQVSDRQELIAHTLRFLSESLTEVAAVSLAHIGLIGSPYLLTVSGRTDGSTCQCEIRMIGGRDLALFQSDLEGIDLIQLSKRHIPGWYIPVIVEDAGRALAAVIVRPHNQEFPVVLSSSDKLIDGYEAPLVSTTLEEMVTPADELFLITQFETLVSRYPACLDQFGLGMFCLARSSATGRTVLVFFALQTIIDGLISGGHYHALKVIGTLIPQTAHGMYYPVMVVTDAPNSPVGFVGLTKGVQGVQAAQIAYNSL